VEICAAVNFLKLPEYGKAFHSIYLKF